MNLVYIGIAISRARACQKAQVRQLQQPSIPTSPYILHGGVGANSVASAHQIVLNVYGAACHITKGNGHVCMNSAES